MLVGSLGLRPSDCFELFFARNVAVSIIYRRVNVRSIQTLVREQNLVDIHVLILCLLRRRSLILETSAIHSVEKHVISNQPLLIKPIFSLLTNAENQLFFKNSSPPSVTRTQFVPWSSSRAAALNSQGLGIWILTSIRFLLLSCFRPNSTP